MRNRPDENELRARRLVQVIEDGVEPRENTAYESPERVEEMRKARRARTYSGKRTMFGRAK